MHWDWLENAIKFVLSPRYAKQRVEKWLFGTTFTGSDEVQVEFYVKLGIMNTDRYIFTLNLQNKNYTIRHTGYCDNTRLPEVNGIVDINLSHGAIDLTKS